MIVWGSRGDVLDLGPRGMRKCQSCEKDRPFDLKMQYRYGGLYWVFNFVMERKYLLLCSTCGRGWQLPNREVEAAVKSIPIPFMRRFGLLTLVGIVILFGVGSSIGR
jgi:hypothetical protein